VSRDSTVESDGAFALENGGFRMEMKHIHRRVVRTIKGAFLFQKDPRLELLKRMPRNSVCAEIGVWKGDFSREIVKRTSPKMLHLIDPWRFQPEFPERKYGGNYAKEQEDMDRIFEAVKVRFEGVPNVSIHRAFSDAALTEFPDGHFDWLYLDGNHVFEYILRDLKIGFGKVRSGGFVSGDDYTWGRKCGLPVEKAVRHFAEEEALEKQIEILGSQFIIKKP
jgi:hypothetical protein